MSALMPMPTAMRLFVAHFLIQETDRWFAPDGDTEVRRQDHHRLDSCLFTADDPQAAYARALAMVPGLSDAHCDGPGDRTEVHCLGLHDLDEVGLNTPLDQAVQGPYGLQLAVLDWPSHPPQARARNELSLFRHLQADPEAPEAIQRLHAWLTAQRPAYLALLQPGVSDAQLDALEARWGLPLPPAFRAFYRWRNGQPNSSSTPLTGNWTWMSLQDLAETKQMLDDMIGYDFDDPAYWRDGWIPFLDNGGGSYLCLDLKAVDGGQPGQVIAFWKADADRPVKAPDFASWLQGLPQQAHD